MLKLVGENEDARFTDRMSKELHVFLIAIQLGRHNFEQKKNNFWISLPDIIPIIFQFSSSREYDFFGW